MLKRFAHNPILTRKNIPNVLPHLHDVSSVFNPGATKFNDSYILLLRVQNRGRETFTLKATSDDGIHFEVETKIIGFNGIERINEKIFHVYDPQITFLDDVYYIMFAMDMPNRCQLGLAKTTDFESYEFLDIVGFEDIRNGVLFPEKVDGRYLRFERPNKLLSPDGPTTGTEIFLSESEDLIHWRPVGPVINGRFHYWDEVISSGPPPIKTKDGWLHIYHGVAQHLGTTNIYQAGAILCDLHDPSKVLARTHQNILEPRELWELVGQVPNVVFPSGLICEEFDSEGFALPESQLKIYYGAANTVVGLATCTVKELIQDCLEF